MILKKLTVPNIYIPLWSYSNRGNTTSDDYSCKFTFHYGPIQIIQRIQHHGKRGKFTFHYGPIQMITNAITDLCKSEFTFHYGPIQMTGLEERQLR